MLAKRADPIADIACFGALAGAEAVAVCFLHCKRTLERRSDS